MCVPTNEELTGGKEAFSIDEIKQSLAKGDLSRTEASGTINYIPANHFRCYPQQWRSRRIHKRAFWNIHSTVGSITSIIDFYAPSCAVGPIAHTNGINTAICSVQYSLPISQALHSCPPEKLRNYQKYRQNQPKDNVDQKQPAKGVVIGIHTRSIVVYKDERVQNCLLEYRFGTLLQDKINEHSVYADSIEIESDR